MSAHTPAPWKAGSMVMNDGAVSVISDHDTDVRHIAFISAHTAFKRGQGWQLQCDTRDANARLIAAAPELLEACQWALNYIDTLIHPEAPKVCDALKSAIAKARGES